MSSLMRRLSFDDSSNSSSPAAQPAAVEALRIDGRSQLSLRGSFTALTQDMNLDDIAIGHSTSINSEAYNELAEEVEFISYETRTWKMAERKALSVAQEDYLSDVIEFAGVIHEYYSDCQVPPQDCVDAIQKLLVHDERVFDGSNPVLATGCLDCAAALLMAATSAKREKFRREMDVEGPVETFVGIPVVQWEDEADRMFLDVLEDDEAIDTMNETSRLPIHLHVEIPTVNPEQTEVFASPSLGDLLIVPPASAPAKSKSVTKLRRVTTDDLSASQDDLAVDRMWIPIASHQSVLSPPQPLKKLSLCDMEILKPISKGGFGAVFLARLSSGHLVAVKMLSKSEMLRKNTVAHVMAERQILSHTENRFVVQFYSSFHTNDNLYLVMEYLPGGDLFSLLRVMGCLEENVARYYIAETVLALEYLHGKCIVHRDIKPDNILIGLDGHIRLTDFGLSLYGVETTTDVMTQKRSTISFGATAPVSLKEALSDNDILSREPSTPQFSRTITSAAILPTVPHTAKPMRTRKAFGTFKSKRDVEDVGVKFLAGTPDYLAPEIVLGHDHSFAVDWWALGVMLFEFLTGNTPFSGDSAATVFRNILKGDVEWPEGVPISEHAKDLVGQLLQLDPDSRLGTRTSVRQHPFFDGLDWDSLEPPFVPDFEDSDVADLAYFEPREEIHPTNRPSLLAPIRKDILAASDDGGGGKG